jgi:uncharacterized protein YfaS (alpha-2-macroglobulin family)
VPLANAVVQFTNLGMYLRQNDTGLWGQTRALDTGTPVFASVFFKQRNGEVLYRTDTDVQGRFQLAGQTLTQVKPLLHRIEVVRGEDSVEIFLQEGAIPLREFPVTGADHRLPLQAFVYSDRGLYRLGETIHLTTLVRHWDLTAPGRPDGRVDHCRTNRSGQARHTARRSFAEWRYHMVLGHPTRC